VTLEFRTFYGVLQHMAAELRKRAVTHVVMDASEVYSEPVYYALAEQDFKQVAVINPAHARALKGHKTDARDWLIVSPFMLDHVGSQMCQQHGRDLKIQVRYACRQAVSCQHGASDRP
jgi:Transposase